MPLLQYLPLGPTQAPFPLCTRRRSIPEQLAAQQEAAYIEEEETGPPLGTKRQYLVVMRHGERLDEVDVEWRGTAERPWDPPLSPKGEQQARDAAKRLKPFNFDRVIISPFRRCHGTGAWENAILVMWTGRSSP